MWDVSAKYVTYLCKKKYKKKFEKFCRYKKVSYLCSVKKNKQIPKYENDLQFF